MAKVKYFQANLSILRLTASTVLEPHAATASQAQSLRHSTLHVDESRHSYLHLSRRSASVDQTVSFASRSGAASPVESDQEDSINTTFKVGLNLHDPGAGFTNRANTLAAYLEANRHVFQSTIRCFPYTNNTSKFLSSTTWTLPSDPENRALIDQKVVISADSMVGGSTRIEERSSVKRSVIGKHCHIGKMVKITGCVILDHCVISEG